MTILGCSAKALTGLARIRRQRGEIDTAMGLLRQATEINPDYMDAYRMMLEISEERGNRAGIVHAASVLHDLSPENPRYTLMLARTYLEMEHFEASERYFKLTISLSPRIAEAYKGLGHVYLAQDEYEKAMRNLKKALDL